MALKLTLVNWPEMYLKKFEEDNNNNQEDNHIVDDEGTDLTDNQPGTNDIELSSSSEDDNNSCHRAILEKH